MLGWSLQSSSHSAMLKQQLNTLGGAEGGCFVLDLKILVHSSPNDAEYVVFKYIFGMDAEI